MKKKTALTIIALKIPPFSRFTNIPPVFLKCFSQYFIYFQFIIIEYLKWENVEFLDKKKTTETFLHRDTEHCTVLYTLFYLISIYINSCKNQLSKLQVFWKICWGALKSFQHCGQIFIFQWNLLKEENLYIPVLYNFFWMFNVVFFFFKT